MKYTFTSDAEQAIFHVEGSLSIENLASIELPLKKEIDDGKHVVIDLSGVTFIDSSSIRFITHYFNMAAAKNRQFLLVGINSEIAEMFSITEIDRKITILKTLEEASSRLGRR